MSDIFQQFSYYLNDVFNRNGTNYKLGHNIRPLRYVRDNLPDIDKYEYKQFYIFFFNIKFPHYLDVYFLYSRLSFVKKRLLLL